MRVWKERQTKTCTKCGETKGLAEFNRQRKGKCGRTAKCRVCTKKEGNEYSVRCREKILERGRQYQAACRANPIKRAMIYQRTKQWWATKKGAHKFYYLKHREKKREYARKRNALRRGDRKYRQWRSMWAKKQVAVLSDWHVKKLLIGDGFLRFKDVPPALIEAKCELLKIHRLIKQKEKTLGHR